jgi:hypothetical protein
VRLLDQLRERIRYFHYSIRTEKAYVYRARFFIRRHGLRHPREMAGPEVEAFLSHRANERIEGHGRRGRTCAGCDAV